MCPRQPTLAAAFPGRRPCAGVRAGMPIVKLVDSFIGKFDVIANEGPVITVFVRAPPTAPARCVLGEVLTPCAGDASGRCD